MRILLTSCWWIRRVREYVIYWPGQQRPSHYNDVIMGGLGSRNTSLTIVYSTVYSGANQRKYQSSTSLAFVRGIHRGPVNSPHKWPVTRKMSPFDDVIMDWRRLDIDPPRNFESILQSTSNWGYMQPSDILYNSRILKIYQFSFILSFSLLCFKWYILQLFNKVVHVLSIMHPTSNTQPDSHSTRQSLPQPKYMLSAVVFVNGY